MNGCKRTNSADVADMIADRLAESCRLRGQASLVVCGGSSPEAVFSELSEKQLDWQQITVTLADDRLVPPTHGDSNIALVKSCLLVRHAAAAVFFSLQDMRLERLMPFDLVLLGMGTDGHIASLFPDMMADKKAFDSMATPAVLTTGPEGSPAHPRITMNLAMLTQSRDIFLLIRGEEKRQLLAEATSASQPFRFPVSALMAQTKALVSVMDIQD